MVRSILCLFMQSLTYLCSHAQPGGDNQTAFPDSASGTTHLKAKSLITNNTILLEWNGTGKNGFYIIERSTDLVRFEVIGVIKTSAMNKNLQFLDEKPSYKRNYYRIKTEVEDEETRYSDTTMVRLRDSVFCKFYPNPVDKLLILRSDYTAALTITDVAGRPRIVQKVKPGVQVLDLSCLEKDIYIITIFHEESNQQVTKKLIKN